MIHSSKKMFILGRIVEITRYCFNLKNGRKDLALFHEMSELLAVEVAHADVPHKSLFDQLLHLSPSVLSHGDGGNHRRIKYRQ